MSNRTGVTAPIGFLAAGAHCGIKKDKIKDLALIFSDRPATAWGVFTTNIVKGAPVIVSKEHIKHPATRAIVINSGNANTVARNDLANAKRMAKTAAECLGISLKETLVASTGVIGEELPIKIVERGILELAPYLKPGGGRDAAQAMMTTDTVIKEATAKLKLGSKNVTIGSCAKGAGMIHPNMATMLAIITTDAALTKPVLKDMVRRANAVSFDCISVDGDVSTSDMFIVMANGASGAPLIEKSSGQRYSKILDKVTGVCVDLAQQIARDGEGATKFITVDVTGAAGYGSAKKVAMSIAASSLVKTAMFGEDANWGRILSSAGYAGVPFDLKKVTLKIGNVTLYRKGVAISGDRAKKVKALIKKKDIAVSLDLGQGRAKARVWTCDLSYDYIKINADYRT